jgi:lipoate-protein ligase A
MSSVKLNKKSLLEKLQAEITLRLGTKISQQEILDKTLEFVYNRLDEFILENIDSPKLTDEIIERLKKNAIDAPLEHPEKSDDELIYGL